MKKTLLCSLSLFFLYASIYAQKYTFPVNNGQKCILTGNFAEIRGSHFHTGLDIAVDENTPVKSFSDGYVSKVRVSSFGYGKVLYITHPDSKLVTVYAHLNGFNANITNLVRQEQYKKELFEVEIEFAPNQLPIKKSEVVAFTGNTGYSFGAHLHYEIRDLNDVGLNPMHFDFDEIPKDNLPPIIKGIAITTFGMDSRVNQQFGSFIYDAQGKSKSKYSIKNKLEVWGEIGFEISTHDVANGSGNTFGTTNIELRLDGQKVFSSDFNRISHENNPSTNVHIDYVKSRQLGKDFQRCYVADGNKFIQNYQFTGNRGKITIKDENTHQVEIIAKDVWGNTSSLVFQVKGKRPTSFATFVRDTGPMKSFLHHDIQENTLIIYAGNIKENEPEAKMDFAGILLKIPVAYTVGKTNVYLWDLRKGLPDAVYVGNNRKYFFFKMIIPSTQTFYFESKEVELNIPKESLYDTLFLDVRNEGGVLDVANPNIPLFKSVKIAFKTNFKGEKTHVYASSSGNTFLNGIWSLDRIAFESRVFGKFKILSDKSKPYIQLLQKNSQKISFQVGDDLSGIKKFKAQLNGKFILMNYEHKTKTIWSEALNQKETLKGNFYLEVEDGAGNKNNYSTKL